MSDATAKTSTPKRSAGSIALAVLGFAATLGVGFYAGQWIKETFFVPPADLEEGVRFKAELRGDEPQIGPNDALVTIVEFSDFQCPYCSKGRAVMDQVVAKYGNKVRLVFRDFPLDFHEKAQKAAEAGQCANDQGKFWAMHDWMFDNQQNLDVDSLKNAAKTLGIDSAKFDNCLTSGQHAALVKKNIREGQEAGVRGTPAFFVNGTFLSGALPLDKFSAEIDRALAE